MKKRLVDAEAWLSQCAHSWMYYNTAKHIIERAPSYEVEEGMLTGEYVNARLLVLPGTEIYDKHCEKWEVQRVELGMGGDWLLRCGRHGTEDYCAFDQEDVGDEWFLDLAAAELHAKVLPGECRRIDPAPEKAVKEAARVYRCRACGAEITWIKMPSGKAMPCDAGKVRYRADPAGKERFVTERGSIVRGVSAPDGESWGCVSHFKTCPKAEEFRRKT